jgi:nitroimidazol reductase NimA-like FMN-containing flavoprotein (pyridoxamine 5'-phosphate oxidase superfamily)
MRLLEPTSRTTLRRRKERGSFDRELIDSIVDEALICHVAFVHDGHPFVLPTSHVRVGDWLYVHGARRSRLLEATTQGAPACISITLLDGLVLGRSAMHHSMNYRSVVILASGREVTSQEEKLLALEALVDRAVPGRSREVRPPSEAELKATRVVAFAIEEASAKVRQGPPVDLASDLDSHCFAGVIPLTLVACAAVPDPQLGPLATAAPATRVPAR